MNILFIGSNNLLSLKPFTALIESKHTLCAFAFDEENKGNLNTVTEYSIQSLALQNNIPLIRLDKNYSDAVTTINLIQPDIILVSCYARLLPQTVFSSAKIGAFNIHPSMLPKFRGPAPIFWQLRNGAKPLGVSLHRIDESYDTGNIVLQKKMKVDDGISHEKLTDIFGDIASDLTIELLEAVDNNKLIDSNQIKELASYQSFPIQQDYSIKTTWTAKRIYNFISGYKGKDIYFTCELKGEVVNLMDALSYQNVAYAGMEDKEVLWQDENIKFCCNDGYVECLAKLN